MAERCLDGVRVLIVEDDPLLLLDLELTLSGAGAVVVGLCQTLDEALRRSHPVDFAVAVLDFRLGEETASPVARRLEDEGVPFVFYTGRPATSRAWPNGGIVRSSKSHRRRMR